MCGVDALMVDGSLDANISPAAENRYTAETLPSEFL